MLITGDSECCQYLLGRLCGLSPALDICCQQNLLAGITSPKAPCYMIGENISLNNNTF